MRAVFAALRAGLERAPELFARVRLHFVGTTYGVGLEEFFQLKPIAAEMGLGDYVDEHPGRVSFLDALQLQLDSQALMILGSDAPHYTASKIFPNVLSRRPLLTVFHEDSSVVRILRETQAGEVVTFNSQSPPGTKVEEISLQLEKLLKLPEGFEPPTNWAAFAQYTTTAMAGRLAASFEKAILKDYRSCNATAARAKGLSVQQ